MRYKKQSLVILSLVLIVALAQCTKLRFNHPGNKEEKPDRSLIAEGKNIFRFDSFGDEDFWSGLLHIDKAIAGEANGGYGPGVSPETALKVGLKVDAEAIPAEVVAGIQNGTVKLDNPATTLALLKLDAVVGVKGNFTSSGALQSVGITCAVCHSTVMLKR